MSVENNNKTCGFQESQFMDILEPLEDVMADVNNCAVFECKITSPSESIITWLKDGRAIEASHRIRNISNKKWHRLEIKSVNPTDHGVYTVVCKNKSNQTSSAANLYVVPRDSHSYLVSRSSPKKCLGVTKHLLSVKAKIGERVELEVEFQSEATADILWFKGNKPLVQDERTIILSTKTTSALSIVYAQITDTGIYSAVSKTKYGIASSSANVHVIADTIDEEIPIIEEPLPDELEVIEKEEARLVSKVKFNLHSSIRWYKNGMLIEDKCRFVHEEYGNKYIGLRIHEPSKHDTAEYTLSLTDELSKRKDSCCCFLTVNPSPMKSPPLIKLKKGLDSVVACCGSKVTFNCSFNLEDPKYFYVVWYVGHFRVERTNSRFKIIYKGGDYILYIRKLEPSMAGEVTCELRRALPNRSSILINSTSANLAIVPTKVLEEEVANQSLKCRIYKANIRKRISMEHKKCNGSISPYDIPKNGSNGNGQFVKNHTNGNHSILEITYSRLEEHDLYFLYVSDGEREVQNIRLVVDEKREKECDVRTNDSKVITLEWDEFTEPSNIWYGIDLGQDNGEFVEAGVTSVPMFEVKDPPVGKLMKFRVRPEQKRSDSNESRVCIMPSVEEGEKISKEHELKPMENFEVLYSKTGDVIGCGAFGSVALVQDKNGEYYAAKVLKTRTQKKRDTALREFEMMRRLRHSKLVELNDAFVAKESFILVMDYLCGGELFDRIVEEEHIKEVDVVPYVRQICEALEYLHKHKIAHLDLKPENIICLSPNSMQVKIIDFGLARILDEEQVTRAIYGTRDYVAPEVLNFERLTLACDMWSLGVVTYMLLSGVMPFAGESWPERSANITMANYNYDETAFKEISSLAKDFVDKLLVLQADKRMSASKALNHTWIVEGPPRGAKAGHMKRARENLKSYLANYRARWQRAGNVMIAAHRLRTQAAGYRASASAIATIAINAIATKPTAATAVPASHRVT